ncbi:MAG: hypothetical protein IPH89_12595 [Bacteroidetes bacterium]|nr:hypothetical protein [Bacteroidota bacterium]
MLGANFRLRGYEPLLKFIKFQKRMEDEYGYSPENIHSIFVLEAKKETEQLISADIARYYYADRNLIFQTRKKIQEFYKMR